MESSKLQLRRYHMWMAEDGINPRESPNGAYVYAHEALAEIERLRTTIKHMCDNLCSPGDCQHPDCPRAAAAPESRDG